LLLLSFEVTGYVLLPKANPPVKWQTVKSDKQLSVFPVEAPQWVTPAFREFHNLAGSGRGLGSLRRSPDFVKTGWAIGEYFDLNSVVTLVSIGLGPKLQSNDVLGIEFVAQQFRKQEVDIIPASVIWDDSVELQTDAPAWPLLSGCAVPTHQICPTASFSNVLSSHPVPPAPKLSLNSFWRMVPHS